MIHLEQLEMKRTYGDKATTLNFREQILRMQSAPNLQKIYTDSMDGLERTPEYSYIVLMTKLKALHVDYYAALRAEQKEYQMCFGEFCKLLLDAYPNLLTTLDMTARDVYQKWMNEHAVKTAQVKLKDVKLVVNSSVEFRRFHLRVEYEDAYEAYLKELNKHVSLTWMTMMYAARKAFYVFVCCHSVSKYRPHDNFRTFSKILMSLNPCLLKSLGMTKEEIYRRFVLLLLRTSKLL